MKKKKMRKKTKILLLFVYAFLLVLCLLLLYIYHIEQNGIDGYTGSQQKEIISFDPVPGSEEHSITEVPLEKTPTPKIVVKRGDDIIVSNHVKNTELAITPYAYNTLTEEEKSLYDELYNIITCLGENIELSTKDLDATDKIFNCIMMDHPEIYYISGYSITKYTRANEIVSLSFTGTYTANQEQIENYNPMIEAYVRRCFEGLPDNYDEYEKVKYVYEYIIKHTNYNLDAPDNQNILSVFINGQSVCKGYAKATQYLLNRLGIYCTFVEGVVQNGEPHAWNLVKINDNYYHVDTTWGDSPYTMNENNDSTVVVPNINYDYLCVTDYEIKKTHFIDTFIQLPDCNSMQDNYYVREGLYFYDFSVDEERLHNLFDSYYNENKNSLTIKCSVPTVYDIMVEYLITDGNVFDYLQDVKSVKYIKMDEQNTIIIYL